MKITRLVLGELETNCYLVSAENGEGLIIDPADDADTILKAVEKETVAIKAVILTHVHFDHMMAAEEVCAALNVPLYVGVGDSDALTDPNRNLSVWFSPEHPLTLSDANYLHEGDSITIGSETLTVLETPGHTPGCICLHTEGTLISGDTLFRNSIGRLDFPGGNPQSMAESLERLLSLPGDTMVYSGHGPSTTIEWEIKTNPFLR